MQVYLLSSSDHYCLLQGQYSIAEKTVECTEQHLYDCFAALAA